MGAYMYPIIIKKDKQLINYSERRVLPDDVLTLDFLSTIVSKEDYFTIQESENAAFGPSLILTVFKERLETDQEQETRVNKEVAYMVEYNKRHPQN